MLRILVLKFKKENTFGTLKKPMFSLLDVIIFWSTKYTGYDLQWTIFEIIAFPLKIPPLLCDKKKKNALDYFSKENTVDWKSKWDTVPLKGNLTLNHRSSILASRSLNASSFEMRRWSLKTQGSGLKLRWSRIDDRGSRVEKHGFPKEQCYRRSVLVVQCSVTVWIARVWQAFNKCKSIYSFSKIYPTCTVYQYVAFSHHVPRWTVWLGNSFCELSLSQFYANLDEDYDTVKSAYLSSLNLFHVNAA